MNDFISDADMEKLSTPAPTPSPNPTVPHAADFISDADMDALHTPQQPAHADAVKGQNPVVSDADLNAMANPDHAKVNEMVRLAVAHGLPRDSIVDIARKYGVENPEALAAPIDTALAYAKRYGKYDGYVDVFQNKPQVRTAPKNDVSSLEALATGAGQGLSFGYGDEIEAGLHAAGNSVKGLFGGGTGESFHDHYIRDRDENRAYLHDAEEQHPWLYGGGQVAGAILPSLAGGAEITGARLLARAAGEGALYGSGQSEAQDVGGVLRDAAVNGALAGATAGAVNRVGAAISPTVGAAVRNLMGHDIPLTPGQILQDGGRVGAWVGRNLEDSAKGVGPIATLSTSAAEKRGNVALNRAILDEALTRDPAAQNAARSFEAGDPTRILPVAAQDASRLDAASQAQARAILDAQSRGLNAVPRHPDLPMRAQDARNTVDFLRTVAGSDAGQASADDLVQALRRRSTEGALHPDEYAGDLPANVTSLIDDAKRVMGQDSVFDSIGHGLSPSVTKLAKLLAGGGGYLASHGATIPLDAAVGALYSPIGQRIAQNALTGRQGPIPKAARGILERLAPLAGTTTAINNGN